MLSEASSRLDYSIARITITSRKKGEGNISGREETGFLGNTDYENLALAFNFFVFLFITNPLEYAMQ